jgi:hypothetical protein
MWETIFSSEGFWSVVSLVLTTLVGLLWTWLRKKGLETEAVDTLRTAVAKVQDEYVTFLKRAAEDGKLTEEERAEARNLAVEKALELAKGPVLKILLAWGKPKLEGLVARIVQGDKE